MTKPKLPPLPLPDYVAGFADEKYNTATVLRIQREAVEFGREYERSMQGQIPQQREPSDSRITNAVGETAAAEIAAHHPAPNAEPAFMPSPAHTVMLGGFPLNPMPTLPPHPRRRATTDGDH